MADITVIKKQRTTAKGTFTRKLNILSRLLEGITDLSEIEISFNDINDAWKIVEQKHDAYVDALTEEDTSVDSWIEEAETTYLKFRKAVLSYRIRVNKEEICSSHTRTFEVQQKSFNSILTGVDVLIKQDCLPETLSNEIIVLASQFERLKDAYTSYVSIASQEVAEELLLQRWVFTLNGTTY